MAVSIASGLNNKNSANASKFYI